MDNLATRARELLVRMMIHAAEVAGIIGVRRRPVVIHVALEHAVESGVNLSDAAFAPGPDHAGNASRIRYGDDVAGTSDSA